MDIAGWVTDDEHRQLLLDAARRVLREVVPEEEPVALGFLVPILDMAAAGEFVVVETADRAGGFGTVDLVAVVVVPLLALALPRALGPVATLGPPPAARPGVADSVTAADVRDIARRCQSRRARRLESQIAAAVNRAIDRARRAQDGARSPAESGQASQGPA